MRKASIFLLGSVSSISLYLFYPLSLPPSDYNYEKFPIPKESANPHFLTKIPSKIGIIGAGMSGIITGKTLSQQGYDVEILEKSPRVGGVWHKNYFGVGLQAPFWHYTLVDFGFEEGVEFIPKLAEIQKCMEDYVNHFGLMNKIKFNHFVENVKQNPDDSWSVQVKSGEKVETKNFDFLILASGLNNKFIPDVPGKEKFRGQIVHNSELFSPDMVKGKNVVVIGGGKGAMDMLSRIDGEAKSITSIMRKPKHYIPTTKKWGVSCLSFYTTRFPTLFMPNIDIKGTEYVYQYGGFVKKFFFNWLRSYNEDIPEFLCSNKNIANTFPTNSIARDDITLDAILKKRINLIKGSPKEITPEGVISGGSLFPADLIIFATGGQRADFGLAPKTGKFWIYRNSIKPGLKNLAFIGNTPTIYTPLLEVITACWLIDVLRGKVKLPSDENMNKEVECLKNKIEKKYGFGSSNGWVTLPLIDLMLKDMGISNRRKKNNYEHWFSPLLPADYLGVVTHRK